MVSHLQYTPFPSKIRDFSHVFQVYFIIPILSSGVPAIVSNSNFNKFARQSPLRYAQRDASAGPVSKKGQAFGLAFFADTRAHS
jgi:hypothetical protein